MLIKFTTFTTFVACILFAAFSSVSATPVAVPEASNDFSIEARDVFTPPVTYPKTGTVWFRDQVHTVKWSTKNHPVNITNSRGFIKLRSGGLTGPLILAAGFNILDGQVKITVPWVDDSDDYQLVLFGDSGNFSQEFTIKSTRSNGK